MTIKYWFTVKTFTTIIKYLVDIRVFFFLNIFHYKRFNLNIGSSSGLRIITTDIKTNISDDSKWIYTPVVIIFRP